MDDLIKSTQKLLTAGMVIPFILGGMFLMLHLDVTRKHFNEFAFPLLASAVLFFLLKVMTDYLKRARTIYFLRCLALWYICMPWLSIAMYSFYRWDPVEVGILALSMVVTAVVFAVQFRKRLEAISFAEQENIKSSAFDLAKMSWHPTKKMIVAVTNENSQQQVRDARKLWFLPVIAIVALRVLINWLVQISVYLPFYLLLFLPLTEVGKFALYCAQFVFVCQLEQKYQGKIVLSKKPEGLLTIKRQND